MENLGIETIGDLAKYDLQKLITLFGKSSGIYFHNASMGIDDSPVQERGEAESISRIHTLKEDTRDLNIIFEKAEQLCEEVYERILKQGLSFKTIGIIIITTDLNMRTRSKTIKNPTNDLELLKKTVKELFEKIINETKLEARRLGVKVSNFTKEKKKQKQLTDFIDIVKT